MIPAWRKAVTVSMALAAAAAILGGCVRGPDGTGRQPDRVASPTGSAIEGDGIQPTVSTAVDPAALDVASAFVTVWAQPGLTRQAWYREVTAYTVPAYATQLATIDPALVPAMSVTSAPVVVMSAADVLVTDVPTNVGPVRVTVVRLEGRWLVAALEPPEPKPDRSR